MRRMGRSDGTRSAHSLPSMQSIMSMKSRMLMLSVGCVKASKGSSAWSFWTQGSWQIHSLPRVAPSSQRSNIQPKSLAVTSGLES